MTRHSNAKTTALAELVGRMRDLKQKIDPTVLERLRLAQQGQVPYDRDSATEAVRQFLDNRSDGGRFREELASKMRRRSDTH